MDTGGLRRQFFSIIFNKMANSFTMMSRNIFEGPPNRLRPAHKASLLSSGMLKNVGTMVAHSILIDGQGFPFLADHCYYYIAGCYDHSVTCITEEDIGIRVKTVINEVRCTTTFSNEKVSCV